MVIAALRNINTALPWNRRILLGPDISTPSATEDIPTGEIHVHFTNGRTSWPDREDGYPPRILGIGGANIDREVYKILSGFAYIDRTAVGTDRTAMEFVITHELLHAYGIGAHVDPTRYPNSIMVPSLRHRYVPRIFLTLDGEALLAESKIRPGTPISSLTPTDLGPWSSTAFHLLGWIDLGGENNDLMQFGAGFRNGLSKPWAYGPVPMTLLQDNPGLAGQRRATWTGHLLGFTGIGRTVAGDAEIGIDLQRLHGRADFTNLESWDVNSHPGTPGSGRLWGDGDLGYTVGVMRNGNVEGFVSIFAAGDDPGVVTGAFVGKAHEGATGVLEHPDLSASFGAVR
ncbi:MAG: hypothetical protein OXF88_08005 [Rhodobacteraceae bacterium]|nr:hypothetical protein [Paracoccaceae bacterium]MCY4137277.1 hypothetical protein [Paracoccaceae bacterium]